TAPVPPPAVADWRTYRRLGRYLRPYAPRLFVVLAISLASTALNLAQPYLSKLMIDDALMRHDLRMLAIISGALLGVTLTERGGR
ncbi:ABC transporter, partial [Halomonas sp. ND22Bw]